MTDPKTEHASGGSRQGRPSAERVLRARGQTLRAQIHDTLLRADAEQYARIAGEVRDADEDAVADLLVDLNMAEISREVQELRDIEGAVQRLTLGTYGVCLTCQEPIAPQRLESFPTAKRCLSCQRRYEETRGMPRPPSL